jgi:hypothetical protein
LVVLFMYRFSTILHAPTTSRVRTLMTTEFVQSNYEYRELHVFPSMSMMATYSMRSSNEMYFPNVVRFLNSFASFSHPMTKDVYPTSNSSGCLFPSFTNIERGEVVEGRVQEPGRGSPPHGLICLLSPRVRPTVTHEPAIPRIPSGDPQIAHHPPRPRSPACPRRDTIRCRACGRACATRGGGIARGPRGRSRGTVRVWSRRARESIEASSSRLMTGIRPVIRHSGSAGGLPGLTSSVSVV